LSRNFINPGSSYVSFQTRNLWQCCFAHFRNSINRTCYQFFRVNICGSCFMSKISLRTGCVRRHRARSNRSKQFLSRTESVGRLDASHASTASPSVRSRTECNPMYTGRQRGSGSGCVRRHRARSDRSTQFCVVMSLLVSWSAGRLSCVHCISIRSISRGMQSHVHWSAAQ
jgi:hypothetical protein